MRQDANGVAGLLSATFGEDATAAEAPLQKLEAMSRLLNAVPGRCSPEASGGPLISSFLNS